MDSIFVGADLKLHRARFHAHTISVIWEAYINLNEGIVSIERNPGNDSYVLKSDAPIPFDIPLALGDCVRCLRSCLDYAMSALARKAGLSDKDTIFPFNEKADGIEPAFSFDTRKLPARQKCIHDLYMKYPDLKDIMLREIKPFSKEHGGSDLGDLLWRIITMDNIDKHRLMTPTVAFVHLTNVKMPGLTLIDVAFQGNFNGGPFTTMGFGPAPYTQPDFTADIVFPEKTRLAGKPVLSALVEGCDAVSHVIEIFKAHFEKC